jgi:hypothetical protein
VDIHRLLVEEGNANVNTFTKCGATPLLVALRQDNINGDVLRFLLSVGARVKYLNDPALNSCARLLIREEVQKLEVRYQRTFSMSAF